jgi:hypothetical protein
MKLTKLVTLALVMTGSAIAQNSDLGILFSVSETKYTAAPITTTNYGIGIQANYSWQILESPSGRLYIEVPGSYLTGPSFQWVFTQSGAATQTFQPVGAAFVTPGLRYHFNVKPRLAVHAAVGGGIAVREQQISTRVEEPNNSSQLSINTGWKGSPAYDLGAGFDFRLTRLLSLRGELRRFRTTAQHGFGDGKTYPVVDIGLALHF